MDTDTALLKELEDQAIASARKAGRLAMEYFRRGVIDVAYKGEGRRDPVTDADRQIEREFRDEISKRYHGHAVLGEESEGPLLPGSITWVIDPIDGTANFASGLPLFSVSIGVLLDGVPLAGAVYVTQPGEPDGLVIHAHKGSGCFRGDMPIHAFQEEQLHPSRPVALPAAFWRRFSLGPAFRWQPIEVRTLGSIAYEATLIAEGVLQLGAYRGPKIWDVAAGVLLVAEAGGAVRYWNRPAGQWLPFQRFTTPPQRGNKQPSALRDWSQPLLIGGASVVTAFARSLRPRQGLQARLWPVLWRLFGG